MSHLNDNVFQNIDRISLKSYDQDEKFHKDTFDLARKNKIADEILIEHKDDIENQNKEFYKAVDKIQIAHRNTKIFLFIMSW
jgi:phosphotransacetylase